MFLPLWIVVPIGVIVILFVLYMVVITLLIVFAEYFARGPANGSDTVGQPIRREQLPTFKSEPRDAGLTRRTG